MEVSKEINIIKLRKSPELKMHGGQESIRDELWMLDPHPITATLSEGHACSSRQNTG